MAIGSLTRIRTNTWALRAYQQLQQNTEAMALRRQRLVTGRRVNRAADDSAAYVISERLRSKIGGQNQALENTRDARGMLAVAEGGMWQQREILQTMKNKAVQAASSTPTPEERRQLQHQIWDLSKEIGTVAEETRFNGKRLLDGSGEASDDGRFTFQVGAGERFSVDLEQVTPEALGLASTGEWAATFDPGTVGLPEGYRPEIDLSSYSGEGGKYKIDVYRVTREYDEAGDLEEWEVRFDIYGPEGGWNLGSIDGNPQFSSSNDLTIGGIWDTAGPQLDGAMLEMTGTDWRDYWEGDPEDYEYTSSYDGRVNGEPVTYTRVHQNPDTGMSIRIGDAALDVTGAEKATQTIENIEKSLATVSEQLAKVGTAQDRLGFKADNLSTSIDAYAAARSRVVDADMAGEQLALTKLQILQRASNAALSQARAAPQSVLSLLELPGGSPPLRQSGGISYQPSYAQAVSAYQRSG